MAFTDLLNPVFQPVLNTLGPFWTVIVLSLFVSLCITLIYKFVTNQQLMKSIKDDMKKQQAQMKTLRDNPKKMMEVQKKAMENNMKYMMESMKATLVTFIPIIIIFGWMAGHLAFEPVYPNTPIISRVEMKEGLAGNVSLRVGDSSTGNVSKNIAILGSSTQMISNKYANFTIQAGTGEYFLEYNYQGQRDTKQLLVTRENKYNPPDDIKKEGPFAKISVVQKKLIVMDLFGWRIGWLGSYIIFSLIASMLFRKVMKVY
jgi:uncharacterized membrane protein (DUF106 family)